MRSVLALLLAASPPGAVVAAPADTAGRFVFRSARVHGEPHRFAVWLPPGFATRRDWPIIVFLHGAGECGRDGERPIHLGLGPELTQNPARWPFVVVFPQKPMDHEEWEEREALVLVVLERARREFRLEAKRAALVGVSQGGHGAWLLGARHPGLWSCLVPVCGYGRARTVAGRVARLPIWAFHGLRDDVVDPRDTRLIMAAVREEQERLGLAGVDARMTLFEDANHNSWDPAFDEPELPGWILAHAARR